MTSEKAKNTRLFYLDNLRTLLIILVLLWHLAITYGASGFWPYQEGYADDLTSIVYTVFNAVNGPYVLGFFFLIAGYFTPASYDRKGAWRFLLPRLLRLGIPLLLYVLVFDPLIYYAIGVFAQRRTLSFWTYIGDHIADYRYGLGVGPLWFVEALLIFTVLYVLWRLVTGLVANNRLQRNGQVPSNITIAVFALLLGTATFIMRIWLPMDRLLQPLGLPLAQVLQYVALFVIGILAYRGNWIRRLPDARGKVWLGITLAFILVLFPMVFALGGAMEGNTDVFMGGTHWQSFAFSVYEQFVGMGMIITLLVWFRRRFDRQGTLAKAMSDSTYAVYFIHAPVLVFLALALRRIRVHLLLKYALVAPVAVSLCFLLAYLIRKLPIARRIL